jgi:hypothetical protein
MINLQHTRSTGAEKPRLSERKLGMIEELFEAGMSKRSIARAVQRSPDTVCRVLAPKPPPTSAGLQSPPSAQDPPCSRTAIHGALSELQQRGVVGGTAQGRAAPERVREDHPAHPRKGGLAGLLQDGEHAPPQPVGQGCPYAVGK